MSEDSIINVKCRILELMSELDGSELHMIEKWMNSESYKKDLENKKKLLSSEKILKKISSSLKKLLPFEGEMPSEKIVTPVAGDQTDCNRETTCHVDEFLFDEKQVEQLVKNGKLKRCYCLDCKSRNIKDLTYISHSMSKQVLLYIFNVLLPKDLGNRQILDLGSRLGSVLYAAYYFSNASKIVGVEINKEFCEVQENIITQFEMDTDRIKVIHSDVIEIKDIIQNTDIIIINVLDFFVDIQKHREIWYFLRKHLKKGTYLVVNSSMAERLSNLDLFEEFMDWLTICKPNQMENEIFFDVEDYSEMYLYSIN